MDRYWFLTWTTYGTWLPGDDRGSVTSVREGSGPRIEHDQPGTRYEQPIPGLAESARAKLKCKPIYLDRAKAEKLLAQFQETARYRQWELCGVAIMANHIHVVVGVPGDPDPEDVMGDFKSYGSRTLNREYGKPDSETWWTGGSGSKRKLKTAEAIWARLRYTRDQEYPLLVWFAPHWNPGPRRQGEPRMVDPEAGEPGGAGEPGASAPGAGEPGASAPGAGEPGASAPGGLPFSTTLSPGADAPGSPAPGADAPGSPSPAGSARNIGPSRDCSPPSVAGKMPPPDQKSLPKGEEEPRMEKKSRLGRGLDALLGGAIPEAEPANISSSEVPLTAIERNPFQPRKSFDPDELSALAESIKHHGVLQPLVVRQVGDHYQLIAGERRFRAAQSVGLQAVPVRIVDFNDQQVLEAALVENIQRTDLNPIEKAQGFKEYLDRFQITHEQLAKRLGLARSTITNLVALLDLPVEIQENVRVGVLSAAHAKALKGVQDRQCQLALAKEILARGLSVHATEALIKQPPEEAGGEPAPSGAGGKLAPDKTAHVLSLENELRQKLSVKVEIKQKANDRGQVILSFESHDDFERILDALRR